MTKAAIYDSIKSTVRSFLPGARVLLFGSRAKGKNRRDSDYDLLIVTKKGYSPRTKMNWERVISKTLVYSVNAPFDVLLQSEKEINLNKNLKGHIVYYALREAVEL